MPTNKTIREEWEDDIKLMICGEKCEHPKQEQLYRKIVEVIKRIREEMYQQALLTQLQEIEDMVVKELASHGFVSDDPLIEKIVQDQKIKQLDNLLSALKEKKSNLEKEIWENYIIFGTT